MTMSPVPLRTPRPCRPQLTVLAVLRASLVGLSVLAATHASAAPCSGFVDVDSASGFCPNVDWIKNRGVTLGCTSTTAYCPNDPVLRLSMAAFMNRLGIALTPTVVHSEGAGATLDLEAAPAALCSTPQFAAADYPRSGRATAVVGVQFATPATIAARIVYSFDNGATWTPANGIPASVGGGSRWANVTLASGDIPIEAAQPVRFGVRVQRDATGAGTADPSAWNCEIKAIVNTRTGSAAPF